MVKVAVVSRLSVSGTSVVSVPEVSTVSGGKSPSRLVSRLQQTISTHKSATMIWGPKLRIALKLVFPNKMPYKDTFSAALLLAVVHISFQVRKPLGKPSVTNDGGI